MKLGVISDTHDDLAVVERAVELFDGRVDAVVHCGDIVAPFSANPFDAEFEFYAVRGNNDGEWALKDAVESFGTYFGEMGELSFDEVSLAVYHGTSLPLVDALVDCGSYDYVLHGHTHQRAHEERTGTVRINPGGVAVSSAGGEPPAGVIVDTITDEVTFHELR